MVNFDSIYGIELRGFHYKCGIFQLSLLGAFGERNILIDSDVPIAEAFQEITNLLDEIGTFHFIREYSMRMAVGN